MKIKEITMLMDPEVIMKQFGVSELCAKVLASRCESEDQIRQVLNTDLSLHVCDSPEMIRILKRLDTARQRNEKILIAGDYDTDGLCATAILKEAFDHAGILNGFYIPDRLKEGYGLSVNTVARAKEKGYSLIITVDNGVSAHEALQKAAECDIEVIVTDHHVIQSEVECSVLLHPDNMGERWKYCCGAGVALQISMALSGPRKRPIMLAAIATIADMMPLWQENRVLVRLGLKYLNERQFMAVESLLDKRCEKWDEREIAFQIVPKLNAGGRLSEICNVNNLVRYLLETDPVNLQQGARQIREVNQKRRQLSDKITKQALDQIDPEADFHVVADDSFHEGIVGLAAGRIMNQTHRPAMVLAPCENGYKGSIRSVPGVDLQEFFADLKSDVSRFGGHGQAAGIEMTKEQLEPLKKKIAEKMKRYEDRLEEPSMEVLSISGRQITLNALHELEMLAPFGQKFDPVLFQVNDCTILNYSRMKEIYPKWQLTNGMDFIDAISFNKEIDEPHPHSWIGKLQINRFRGNEKCSILVESVQ